MKFQNITFKSSDGIDIAGRIDFPVGRIKACAIFAHCFTCNKNLNAVVNISRALNQEGIAVMRFDFTGLGESEGDFADTNFSSQISDLLTAANYMKEKIKAPRLLIGHSLGGAAVVRASGLIPSVEALVTIGAPFAPSHVTHLFKDDIPQLKAEGKVQVNIGGRPFTVKKQFIDDLENHKPAENLRNKPLLIFHSPQDKIVGIDNAADLYQAARHPKSFVSLDKADHLLSNKEDAEYVGMTIAAWVHRYISDRKEPELATHLEVVTRTGEESLATDIKAGAHISLADEPANVPGGHDLGPDPYELLMSSLGACTGMTLQMYAKRKKIDLKEVKVHMSIDHTYAEEKCDDEVSDKLGKISRQLEFVGDITDDQRLRLIQIANKCPVHKTLEGGIHVDTSYLT